MLLEEQVFYVRLSVQLEIKYFKFSYFHGGFLAILWLWWYCDKINYINLKKKCEETEVLGVSCNI